MSGNIHGNETLRKMFHIVFTQYTYSIIVITIYGIPSLLVTIKVVTTILNPIHKNYFRTPFFILYTHDCIVNFLFFIFDYFAYRLPLSGLITGWMTMLPTGTYITVVYILAFQLKYMVFYAAVFISISRAMIICLPLNGTRMVKKLLPMFFLLIYLLPLLTTWFLYPTKCFIKIGSIPGFGVAIDYVKMFPKWRNSACIAIVASVCSFVFLISSLATLSRIRSAANNAGKQNNTAAKAVRSLTIVTFCTLLCIITYAATNVYFLYVSDVNMSLTLHPFQIDLLTFTPVWVLFLTHPKFKSETQQLSLIIVSVNK